MVKLKEELEIVALDDKNLSIRTNKETLGEFYRLVQELKRSLLTTPFGVNSIIV